MTTLLTVRLAYVDPDLEDHDLGRISHEVRPRDLWESLPDRDTDADEYLIVTLWEEDERRRVLRDEREVEWRIADALVEGRLEELLENVRADPRVPLA